MKRNLSISMLLAISAMMPVGSLYAADAGKGEPKSLNSPTADEPVKSGTADKPPQPIAPGTLDAPPKPAAPGTLDKNVINPDVEIRNKGKPKPL